MGAHIAEIALVVALVAFAGVCAYAAVCASANYWMSESQLRGRRALERETAVHEADNAMARSEITKLRDANGRLRNRCVRLLEIADMERSAKIETQIEAREREKQIREEMRNSTFGAFID